MVPECKDAVANICRWTEEYFGWEYRIAYFNIILAILYLWSKVLYNFLHSGCSSQLVGHNIACASVAVRPCEQCPGVIITSARPSFDWWSEPAITKSRPASYFHDRYSLHSNLWCTQNEERRDDRQRNKTKLYKNQCGRPPKLRNWWLRPSTYMQLCLTEIIRADPRQPRSYRSRQWFRRQIVCSLIFT